MDENRFWEIVRKLDWAHHYPDYEFCRERLIRLCTPDELPLFEEKAREKFEDIYERMMNYFHDRSLGRFTYLVPNEWLENGTRYIGEDTWNDSFWHIVGLGKTAYKLVMRSPWSFYKYFDSSQHMLETESFAYVFHDESQHNETI